MAACLVTRGTILVGGQSRGGALSIVYAGMHLHPEQVVGVLNPTGDMMKMPTAIIAACAGTFALAQADLVHAAYASAAAPMSQERAADRIALPEFRGGPETLKRPLTFSEALLGSPNSTRKDIGCIGWHGRSSGVTKNGKCIRKKRG